MVRERTGLAGRRYAGRFYISGITEGDLDVDTVNTTYMGLVTAYCTALSSFLAGGSNQDWDLFVWSKAYQLENPGAPCQSTGARVTSVAGSAIVTTQKSRRG